MNAKTIIFGAMITLLAGCSLSPIYKQPSLPTAAAYPDTGTTRTQSTQYATVRTDPDAGCA